MRTYTKEEIDFLINNYPKFGGEYCSQKIKRTKNAIIKKVNRLGLVLETDIRSSINSNNSIKWYEKVEDEYYNVGIEQFKNIKTPEIAYILGLIWTDGYILSKNNYQRIVLEMNKIDLDEIKFIFDRTGNWSYYSRIKKGIFNRQEDGILKTSNRPLVEYLISLNFNKKSLVSPDDLLCKIPDNLKKYFFRGVVDGDGCFTENKQHRIFSIGGTYEQDWQYIVLLFDKLNIRYKIRKYIKECDSKIYKSSIIEVCNVDCIIKFGNYIYEGYQKDNIGLKRKYEKFISILTKKYNPLKIKLI
jgi:hypothetical protein